MQKIFSIVRLYVQIWLILSGNFDLTVYTINSYNYYLDDHCIIYQNIFLTLSYIWQSNKKCFSSSTEARK